MTPVITKIVMLYLTVYNWDTGAVLYESARRMPEFSLSGDRIEDCRQEGVSQAETLTVRFWKAYPNASTNVVCRWERGQPSQRTQIRKDRLRTTS
jgi:hypothetical protein